MPPMQSSRDHVLRARADKRAQAEAIGIDDSFIAVLVSRFYRAVRKDDLIGPIFAARVEDWDHHLARMNSFWRSILHNSGEFSGNPMLKHLAIPHLDATHFERWLELFYATLRSVERDPAATELVGRRARMIADSLLTGIDVHRSGIKGISAGKDLPHV